MDGRRRTCLPDSRRHHHDHHGPQPTTPSTRSACVLAITKANTKASHGADHGPEATITVAGEPAETPIQLSRSKEEPVQQPPRDAPDQPAGTIETLTTTADDTGQLLLTWDSPSSSKRRPHGLPPQLGQEHRGISRPTLPRTGTTIQPTTTLTLDSTGVQY